LPRKAEIAEITVTLGRSSGKVWFQDLYNHPELDIALRAGDRILVEEDTRSYTAMGATSTQARVAFQSQNQSAIEAIAQVGGLSSVTAGPTGVFVFRNEAAEIANPLLGRDDLIGAQRMIYVINLTEPNGMFIARDFVIRDGDTVYVTEAPFTQWDKTISSTANSLAALAAVAAFTN
jgi:polysaccharide export outer membrane protein